LIGAVSGGIYGATGAISFSNPYVEEMAQVGSGGVAGGIASEMSGRKFSEGFKIGAISTFIMYEVNTFREYSKNALLRKATKILNIKPNENKPLWGYPRENSYWTRLKEAFNQRGLIINAIRRLGSCITCPQLRFSHIHAVKHSNGMTWHWDPNDPVTDFGKHFACDFLGLKLCGH